MYAKTTKSMFKLPKDGFEESMVAKSRVATHQLTNGKTFKQVTTKELLSTLAYTKHTSGRKVVKQPNLDRRCIY